MKHHVYRRFGRCRSLRSFAAVILLASFCVLSVRVLLPIASDFLPWERLEIQQSYLGTCCISPEDDRDVCNRHGCEPCNLKDHDRLQNVQHGAEIFFHETSSKSSLSFRQACAVESAARSDPTLIVNVLMTGEINRTAPSMKALEHYANIRISRVFLGTYFANTPLDGWYFCSGWNRGPYAVSHLSDALRFLTLYKFGGYYLDLDFVMLKPIGNIRNFVGAESESWLAAGALHVDYEHPVIEQAVQEFRKTYKRNEWGYNGPELLTRVLLKHCKAQNVTELLKNDCDFKVLPPKAFYPVFYRNWTEYFEPETDRLNAASLSSDPDVIGAHVWNKFSASTYVDKQSNQLYAKLAHKHCPRVFSAASVLF